MVSWLFAQEIFSCYFQPFKYVLLCFRAKEPPQGDLRSIWGMADDCWDSKWCNTLFVKGHLKWFLDWNGCYVMVILKWKGIYIKYSYANSLWKHCCRVLTCMLRHCKTFWDCAAGPKLKKSSISFIDMWKVMISFTIWKYACVWDLPSFTFSVFQTYLHSMSIIHRDLNSPNCLVKLVSDTLCNIEE